jgi:hypothetical protein
MIGIVYIKMQNNNCNVGNNKRSFITMELSSQPWKCFYTKELISPSSSILDIDF